MDLSFYTVEGWHKATTATTDPLAAANFAAKYLGGVRLVSPYPDPEATEPHYTEWVLFSPMASERPFWLHFVRSAPSPNGALDVTSLSPLCGKGRDFPGDVFDTLLFNSLRFTVENLA